MSKRPRYGNLKYLYPDHFRHFQVMQDRAKNGCGTEYSNDSSGLLEFIEEIGPYPTGMVMPTVGRKDHSKGYIQGNFTWQSRSDNAKESGLRAGFTSESQTGTKQPEDVSKKKSLSMKGKNTGERSTETCQRISESRKGKPLSDKAKENMKSSQQLRRDLERLTNNRREEQICP